MKNTNKLKDFFTAIEDTKNGFKNIQQQENSLEKSKQSLQIEIQKRLNFNDENLSDNSLKSALINLNNGIQMSLNNWDAEIKKCLPMQQLSKAYQTRIVFLIFGKVNAGKSSFINQIVEMYEEGFPNENIRRFYLEQGEIKDSNGKFKEGFVETTAHIQGVELGKHFLLIDTPGLHSVTDENGDLTRQFIDSADAVMWLTPSTSPGQVQELDDLRIELEKGKPLLPVITRSDINEEDWDEEKGELVVQLLNKTEKNRKLQEDDVYSRLQDFKKINTNLIKKPISISVHCYKNDKDLNQSGLDHLFSEMSKLINEATKYKVNKAEKQVKAFLQDSMRKLDKEISSKLNELHNETKKAKLELADNEKYILNEVQSALFIKLIDVIERYKDQFDPNVDPTHLKLQLQNEILNESNQILSKLLQKSLSGMMRTINQVNIKLSTNDLGDFKKKTKKIEQQRTNLVSDDEFSLGNTASGASAGASVGALAGSFVPVIGTVVGGLIGGVLGGLFGGSKRKKNYHYETDTYFEELDLGVDSAEVEKSIQKALKQQLPSAVHSVIEAIQKQISSIEETTKDIESFINRYLNK